MNEPKRFNLSAKRIDVMVDWNCQPAFRLLRDILAERSDAVVGWVGAGLSVAAGLPTWKSLHTTLCNALDEKAMSFPDGPARDGSKRTHQEALSAVSLWDAFSTLKDGLGQETYRSTIRELFKNAERANVPLSYQKLWGLGIRGILNLNIDRLATRGFSAARPSDALNEFNGITAGAHLHSLKASTPFVANLHGIADDFASWVFTRSQLRGILADKGYQAFLHAVFATKTVLFLGISADDLAVGGQLHSLVSAGVDLGTHFWLTDRLDRTTDDWAESSGIRIIRYSNASGTHGEILDFFSTLQSWNPKEQEVTPVVTTVATTTTTGDLSNLQALSGEEIRIALNAEAKQILASAQPDRLQRYETFCKQHRVAIHRGWWAEPEPPENILLGYQLLQTVAKGSFGTVFRAESPQHELCAVKLLHESAFIDRERLHAFRRGVASMQILANHNVAGIVTYREACEIPAFVAMEFVEGINLSEATKKGILVAWRDLLRVAKDLASVIRRAHRLPERVLHRDLRPANIMLRGCWGAESQLSDAEVVVLDFDLSWHVNAYDISIADAHTTNGYLAPELAQRNPNITTRSASVDSFGLGMTLYFMRSGVDPAFAEHRHKGWESTLEGCAANYPCSDWRSVPLRFCRLILRATQHRQSDRLDMAAIEGELSLLLEATLAPEKVQSAEMLCEELAWRASSGNYKWDEASLVATIDIGGSKILLKSRESERAISVEVVITRKGLDKYRHKVRDQFRAHLTRVGFRVNDVNVSGGSLLANASIGVTTLRERIVEVARSIETLSSILSFS